MELDADGHAEHSSCITAVPMEWLRLNEHLERHKNVTGPQLAAASS
jgi:hypothetical protein